MTPAQQQRAAQAINETAREKMQLDVPTVVTPRPAGPQLFEQLGSDMPAMFRLYLDPTIRNAIKDLAKEMAEDTVFTPKHLRQKPAALAIVISKAIAWNMHPDDVADGTYQPTENGPIAFKSKVIHAAIAQHFEGAIDYKHFGDWTRVHNKFKTETSQTSGKKYQVPTWTEKDAEGLGVEVSGRLRGERQPRRLQLELAQCWPRFSTLWATDPKTQICYTALRRFTSLVAPAALMSLRLPGAEDSTEIDMGDAAIVERTPEIMQPQPAQQEPTRQAAPAPETVETDTDEAKTNPAGLPPTARRILEKKLADRELTAAFCAHFGITEVAELPMSKINDAHAWIEKHVKH